MKFINQTLVRTVVKRDLQCLLLFATDGLIALKDIGLKNNVEKSEDEPGLH